MKKLKAIIFLSIVFVCACSCAVSAAERDTVLRKCEREHLLRELTRCYPNAALAERCGICAVVLNRMKDPRYPDSFGGVLESLRLSGEFLSDKKYDETSLRLSRDALSMAMMGADPTNGATSFRYIEPVIHGFGDSVNQDTQNGILKIGNVEFSR